MSVLNRDLADFDPEVAAADRQAELDRQQRQPRDDRVARTSRPSR